MSKSSRSAVKVSAIREIFQQLPFVIEQRKQQNLSPLIDLSIGQPHIEANVEVLERVAAMKIDRFSQGYTPAQGEPATLEAIVQLYKHYYPLVSYDISETMVTVGASGALSNIFSVLVEDADDIILTFEPYFGAYIGQVQEWGGTLQKIPTLQHQFRPTVYELEKALALYPTAKAIVLNYPNNPSGISLRKDELQNLARALEKFPELLIIIDDVYRDFNRLEHITLLDIVPHLKERCVVINSGAKGLLGAPGARIGMMAASADLIKRMIPRQTNGLSSVPLYTQAALRFAVEMFLQNPQNAWLMNAKEEYRNNVSVAVEAFHQQGFSLTHETTGAFYLLVSTKHLLGKQHPETLQVMSSDLDIVKYFLYTAGVATVPGSGFGIDAAEGYLRISCAKASEFLREAAQRIGEAARKLVDAAMVHNVEEDHSAVSVV